MKLGDVSTVVIAVTGLLALIAAMLGWFFKRGGDEKVLASAVNDNTTATRELTGEFREFKEAAVDKLHSLDIRVTRLEVAPTPVHVTTKIEAPQDVRAPADRNAGTPG